MPIERKSAAIMFTDIAGYTEAMSESEQKALDMLRRKRSILKPLIENHQGTYVKEIGDGTLSYFESGYNASACAKEFQKEIQKDDLNIRIGIHIGDIVFDDDDVYGDGVNIASRIESLAPVGGVLISKNVYDELINKDDFEGIHLGLQSLKGVGRLVDVYAIKDDYLVVPKPQDYKETEVQVHSDDEVPSIAIIPFDNKGAEEDVFYAYGISADLISDCSSAGLIRVAGLKEVEELGDMPFKEKAKKLLVRYVATGTLWKMGDMFQLSVELYDTKDKKVVWSDRWQENWDNLPTIKTNLSDGLLKALDATSKIGKKMEIANAEAYEYYLRGKYAWQTIKNKEDLSIVRKLLKKAIELDSNVIEPQLTLGFTYFFHGEFDKSLRIYQDALKTPFYNFGGARHLTPGMEIHANAIQTILDNNYISIYGGNMDLTKRSFFYHFILIGSLALIVMFLFSLQSFYITVIGIVLEILVFISFAIGSFTNDFFWLIKEAIYLLPSSILNNMGDWILIDTPGIGESTMMPVVAPLETVSDVMVMVGAPLS